MYWIKSLVPSEKKSKTGIKSLNIMIADGISIIPPKGILSA
ncbi:hypothetical protein EVA_15564 [gut metagenome]|uniref:Uncharacterized protein n=1 Tax=gut metagenome TaxID=749906 RepID=J9FPD4_9ZZZZ